MTDWEMVFYVSCNNLWTVLRGSRIVLPIIFKLNISSGHKMEVKFNIKNFHFCIFLDRLENGTLFCNLFHCKLAYELFSFNTFSIFIILFLIKFDIDYVHFYCSGQLWSLIDCKIDTEHGRPNKPYVPNITFINRT